MAPRELYDPSRVLFAFRKAPEVFADAVDFWLNKERVAFLGKSTKKDTSSTKGIRGKLLHKPLFGGAGLRGNSQGWSPQVVGQFKSFKKEKDSLNVSLTMEFARGPLEPAMQLLETGGAISSSKFMPIPMYRNLAQIGITKRYYKEFQERAAAGQLIPIHPKGDSDTLLWFYNRFGKKILAFVGKKNLRVHKQFDFHRTWETRLTSVMQRGQKAMDTATRKVERMIAEGEISGL